jgi:hypothetical protein
MYFLGTLGYHISHRPGSPAFGSTCSHVFYEISRPAQNSRMHDPALQITPVALHSAPWAPRQQWTQYFASGVTRVSCPPCSLGDGPCAVF